MSGWTKTSRIGTTPSRSPRAAPLRRRSTSPGRRGTPRARARTAPSRTRTAGSGRSRRRSTASTRGSPRPRRARAASARASRSRSAARGGGSTTGRRRARRRRAPRRRRRRALPLQRGAARVVLGDAVDRPEPEGRRARRARRAAASRAAGRPRRRRDRRARDAGGGARGLLGRRLRSPSVGGMRGRDGACVWKYCSNTAARRAPPPRRRVRRSRSRRRRRSSGCRTGRSRTTTTGSGSARSDSRAALTSFSAVPVLPAIVDLEVAEHAVRGAERRVRRLARARAAHSRAQLGSTPVGCGGCAPKRRSTAAADRRVAADARRPRRGAA